MNVAICDNQKSCIDDICKHLDFFVHDKNIEIQKSTFTSAKELLSVDISFDIAILDVEMDGLNGLQLGQQLRQINPHIVLIYITAHKQYLDDALNLNAVRFFGKPIDSQRFYRGLEDAIKRIDESSIYFYLKDGKTTERIDARDIIYVEIDNRKTKIITLNKVYYSSNRISFWGKKLKSTIFLSPHKSYIINLNFVTAYQRNLVVLADKYNIPIAKDKQTYFHKMFMRFAEGR